MNKSSEIILQEAIDLLKELIATPSFSKEESATASIIGKFLAVRDIAATRVGNNIFSLNKYYDEKKPTILLNQIRNTQKIHFLPLLKMENYLVLAVMMPAVVLFR
jgi:acetylornithine deacetylase